MAIGLLLDQKQPKISSDDIGKEFVRILPAQGDWGWVPSPSYHRQGSLRLDPLKLDSITSKHLNFSSKDGKFSLEKEKWDDCYWMTVEKCRELFAKTPELFFQGSGITDDH